jgi:hypothetical protein
MLHNLTLSVLFCGVILLSACGPKIPTSNPVEIRTVEVSRPAPIIPNVDQLRLRSVNWKVVTPDNVDVVFAALGEDVVLFALTAEGYEALSLNLSDLRANIQQQNQIIAVYRKSYER